MQPDQSPPESGKVAFRYGLIFGLGLFVVAAILVTIGTVAFHGNPISALFTILYWLIGLVAFFLVGMFAAKQTGKVSTGTLAGLWAGIAEGVLYAIFALILFFTYSLNAEASTLTNSSTTTQLGPQAAQQIEIVGSIIGVIFFLFVAIGLGAGLGALGGLVGRATSKYKYVGQPYPGQPYPGQPYPGQPYPGQPYSGQPYPGQSYPGQSYPGQPYPGHQEFGQPYPGQPYPGQPDNRQSYPDLNRSSQPEQPVKNTVEAPSYVQASEEDATKKAENPPNIYNAYLESQETQTPSSHDTTE